MLQQITPIAQTIERTHVSFGGLRMTLIGVWLTCLVCLAGEATARNAGAAFVMPGDTSISATICANETYEFGGQSLNQAGVYTATFTAEDGSDSTVNLNLHVLPVKLSNLRAGICDSTYFVFFGDTLTTSGTYTHVLTATNGCDSIIALKLDVVPFFDIHQTVNICAGGTYIFNGDTLGAPGVYVDSLFAAGGCDSVITLTLNVLPLLSGQQDATICAGDTLFWNGLGFTESGAYTFTSTGSNGCDSTFTLNLNVLPVFHTDVFAAVCSGNSYEYEGDTLTQEGIYTYDFVAGNGCDSTVVLHLSVNPVYNIQLEAAICAGESYVLGADTLTDEGIYTAHFSSATGCDSTVVLVLSVLPTQQTEIDATICAGESFAFNGENLTTAGAYSAVFSGINGCDSTVLLNLSVLPVYYTDIDVTICEGSGGWPYNGQILTTAGDYPFVYSTENGCDSTVTIHLNVLASAKTNIAATICSDETYDFNGLTLNESGEYNFYLTAENGCDSIVTLNLTVPAPIVTELNVSICESSSYIFGADTLTNAGDYSRLLSSAAGCDSSVVLHLTLVPEYMVFRSESICAGESYTFDGQTLTQSGDYTATFTAAGGCDSTVVLSLQVLPLGESITDATICAGASYSFNGNDYNTSGTYTVKLTGVNGCDSAAVLNLTVLPALESSREATICAGTAYPFYGTLLTQSGIYTAALPGSNGCDSTVILHLTVLPAQQTDLNILLCKGDAYDYNGQLITAAGQYSFVFTGLNGCDSIVNIQVNQLPLAQGAFAAVVCNGLPYEYNGETFTQSGEYQFVLDNASANGCDSVVTLYLTIFEAVPPTQTSAVICAGGSYTFNGNVLTASGTYTAILSSSTGCDSTVILTLNVLPAFATSVTYALCKGDTILINGFPVTEAGSITFTFVASNGCDSTHTINVIVNEIDTNVALQNGTLTAAETNAAYQWIDCATQNPIAGANGSSFTPTSTGNYAVIVTKGNCSTVTGCTFVQVTGVQELIASTNWSVQPNPTADYARLVFDRALEADVQIQVCDVSGKCLHQFVLPAGTEQYSIDMTALPQGFYYVRLALQGSATSKMLTKID